MNDDILAGTARDTGGKVKETLGDVTQNRLLQRDGLSDQAGGKLQKTYGELSDTVTQRAGPLVDQARDFARRRPFAAAALAGVVGMALINTLRGRR